MGVVHDSNHGVAVPALQYRVAQSECAACHLQALLQQQLAAGHASLKRDQLCTSAVQRVNTRLATVRHAHLNSWQDDATCAKLTTDAQHVDSVGPCQHLEKRPLHRART